jgi:C-terminal processing protease CtpA/Prc
MRFFLIDLLSTLTKRGRYVVAAVGALIIILLGTCVYFFFFHGSHVVYQTPQEKDPYVRFMMEGYDAVTTNYWVKPGEYSKFNTPELPQLFQLAVQKEGATATLATTTRNGVAALLAASLKTATSTEAKKQFALQTLTIVLYNLPPLGRDGLLSQQQEKALRQDVANVNPGKDLYQDLGLQKGASPTDVAVAYSEKAAALKNATSTEAKAELQKVAYAHEILTNPTQKNMYDTAQIEPSVFSHVLGHTLYLDFDKISPTSLQEFAIAVDAASTTPGLDSMIIDMRGNVGGALDFAPAFLGLFIGSNQYAFDLYHQGDDQVQRTTQNKFAELSRFTDIAVLGDNMTQSTAELTTAVMKRFRIAHVVGTTTHGWGSVENTYPLKTVIDDAATYALLLVNSLTLRDDQVPIEQNGVVPDVDTSKTSWQGRLSSYFTSTSLIQALKDEATVAPLR